MPTPVKLTCILHNVDFGAGDILRMLVWFPTFLLHSTHWVSMNYYKRGIEAYKTKVNKTEIKLYSPDLAIVISFRRISRKYK